MRFEKGALAQPFHTARRVQNASPKHHVYCENLVLAVARTPVH
jgi:hypothetical protein